jgi:hypothetical protein
MTKGGRAWPVFLIGARTSRPTRQSRSLPLAVARHLQDATGTGIKNFVQALHTARSATVQINGQRPTLDPDLTDSTRDILKPVETAC